MVACFAGAPMHAAQAADTKAGAKKEAVKEAAPQPVGETVTYESLEQRVGAELAIETTLITVRRGTLVKYTIPALPLRLGPEHGSIDLTVPHETVRNIRVLVPAASGDAQKPADKETQKQGSGSAQKN